MNAIRVVIPLVVVVVVVYIVGVCRLFSRSFQQRTHPGFRSVLSAGYDATRHIRISILKPSVLRDAAKYCIAAQHERERDHTGTHARRSWEGLGVEAWRTLPHLAKQLQLRGAPFTTTVTTTQRQNPPNAGTITATQQMGFMANASWPRGQHTCH